MIRSTAEERSACLMVADPGRITLKDSGIWGARFDAVFEDESFENLEIRLAGRHQVMNAHLALTALKAMKDHLSLDIRRESIFQGLRNTRWAGRLEVLRQEPLILIDGAHNVHGANGLLDALNSHLSDRRLVGLVGVLADKDFGGILDVVAPALSRAIATVPDSPRALGAEALSEALESRGVPTEAVPEIPAAVRRALDSLEPGEALVCFGSLYLIGQVRGLLKGEE